MYNVPAAAKLPAMIVPIYLCGWLISGLELVIWFLSLSINPVSGRTDQVMPPITKPATIAVSDLKIFPMFF